MIDPTRARLIAHELLLKRLIGTLAVRSDNPGQFLTDVHRNLRKDVFRTLGVVGTYSEEDRKAIFDEITHLLGQIDINPKESTD